MSGDHSFTGQDELETVGFVELEPKTATEQAAVEGIEHGCRHRSRWSERKPERGKRAGHGTRLEPRDPKGDSGAHLVDGSRGLPTRTGRRHRRHPPWIVTG